MKNANYSIIRSVFAKFAVVTVAPLMRTMQTSWKTRNGPQVRNGASRMKISSMSWRRKITATTLPGSMAATPRPIQINLRPIMNHRRNWRCPKNGTGNCTTPMRQVASAGRWWKFSRTKGSPTGPSRLKDLFRSGRPRKKTSWIDSRLRKGKWASDHQVPRLWMGSESLLNSQN